MTAGHTRPPAAVLFDLDGTLIDTSPVWKAAYLELADDLGVSLAEGWWSEVRGRRIAASLAVFGPLADRRQHGPRAERCLASELVSRAEAQLATTTVRWLPGARELLEAVQAAGVPTALVTSAWRTLAEGFLASAGVSMPTVIGGDDVTRGKPAPDAYRLAAARSHADPGECLAVEDSPTGLAAAEAAGVAVLVAPSGERIAAARGRTVVGSLADVRFADLGAMVG